MFTNFIDILSTKLVRSGMLVLGLMAFFAAAVAAQTVPEVPTVDTSSPQALFGSIEALYAAVIVIGGYLAPYIPFIKKIETGVYRVLVWAVITGLGFYLFGGGEVLTLSITYAISTSLYEVVLKWFRPSDPDAEPSEVAKAITKAVVGDTPQEVVAYHAGTVNTTADHPEFTRSNKSLQEAIRKFSLPGDARGEIQY